LILVYTGDGKGKTSAALGTAFRALGHGWRVLVIQFMKGDWPVVFGELESAKKHRKMEVLQLGQGFVRIMGDKKPLSKHRKAAVDALATAKKRIDSGRYDLVVLDEALCALESAGTRLITASGLLSIVKNAPKRTHLILTGRLQDKALKKRVFAAADLVTEMKEIKHPYQKGIGALKGIDH
jgi:cob(I)alamin adenosyltransferase